MQYPRDLIPELAARWSEANPESPFHEMDELLPVLETVYHASMTTDEGRATQLRVLFCDPSRFAHPWIELLPRHVAIPFSLPRPFSEAELRRLAPATDATRVLVGIRKRAPSGGLEIWGLVDLGDSWFKSQRREPIGGTIGVIQPPEELEISSTEPGHIAAFSKGRLLASLRGGRIVGPGGYTLWGGPISEFLDGPRQRLRSTVDAGEDELQPGRRYTAMLERILYAVESIGHGGAVLMVPQGWVQNGDRHLGPVLQIKYAMPDRRIWPLLLRGREVSRRYYELHAGFYRDGGAVPFDLFHEYGGLDMQLKAIEVDLGNATRLIADLTAVDGAVVITDELELVGFGAEVTAPAPVLSQVKVVEGEKAAAASVSIEAFGTRHRSVFRFCWNLPQCIGFIVSQDGGVKAVRRVGDDVYVWSEALSHVNSS